MKKSFIITLTALAALVMSCQKGNVNDVPASDLAEVTFAIELPVAPATKTIGDGTTATELYYAAFNQNGEYIESLAQADVIAISGKTATVNVKLVRNYTYSFVFWAQAPDAPYEFDAETGVVTVVTAEPVNSALSYTPFNSFALIKRSDNFASFLFITY